jgi:hypothetical protein
MMAENSHRPISVLLGKETKLMKAAENMIASW